MQSIFQLRQETGIPKYKQIVNAVQHAIDVKKLEQGSQLPSMNELCDMLQVSRETVFKAYQDLKSRGIISSNPGKGYFVATSTGSVKRRVFLLLDSFTAYKDVLFNSFKEALGPDHVVDLYFHHFNSQVYQSLIQEAVGKYTDYVIVPIPDMSRKMWLDQILAQQSVYILDQGWELYHQDYSCVCQNFEMDIYNGLQSARSMITKYGKIVLIWGESENKYERAIKTDLIQGLKHFVEENNLTWNMTLTAKELKVTSKTCYILSYDFDLVDLVENVESQGLKIGEDVGIISFNESPLKAIAAGGISTLSTDFEAMGREMGRIVRHKLDEKIKNRFELIQRASL